MQTVRSKMGDLQIDQLMPLRDALEKLMRFVRKWQREEAPYFYHYLDYMKNNIEICIYTLEDLERDLEHLKILLLRDWTAANDVRMGIPSCMLFEREQREQVLQYLELLEEVESYFDSEDI